MVLTGKTFGGDHPPFLLPVSTMVLMVTKVRGYHHILTGKTFLGDHPLFLSELPQIQMQITQDKIYKRYYLHVHTTKYVQTQNSFVLCRLLTVLKENVDIH